jgi:hypothetical protein
LNGNNNKDKGKRKKEKGKRKKEEVNLPGSPPWRVPIAIGKGWVKASKTLLTT